MRSPTTGTLTEEGRELLQERLRQFNGWQLALWSAWYLAANIISALTVEHHAIDWLIHPVNRFQLPWLLVTAIVWRYTAGPPRSARALTVVDALVPVTIATLAAFIPFAYGSDDLPSPILVVMGVCSIIVLRAALIPTSARHTAFVSVLVSVPPALMLHVAHQRFDHLTTPEWATQMFLLVFCACAVAISHTFYGLRKTARDALQLGQYRLGRKLGEGGMGEVYEASHAMLRRKTAIKLLPPEKSGDAAIARFEREVQAASELTHPNTVAIHDFGRTQDGIFYYAMELLDGIDLETLVEQYGPQSPARTVHILRQVCGALGEAHDRGLIHRDIKPANIILCERGGAKDVAKVVDFGLVKHVAQDEETRVTKENVISGTPLYLSPEAIVSADAVDGRSDLYALGAVGYCLLTGEPPFVADTVVELCSHHLHTAPAPMADHDLDVPAALEETLLACLAKKLGDRPQTAAELDSLLCRATDERWTQSDANAWWDHVANHKTTRRQSPTMGGSVVIDLGRR